MKKPDKQFYTLIYEYETVIYRTASFYCQDYWMNDLYQEVVLNLWKHYPDVRNQPLSSLSVWVYKISLNTCIAFFRRYNARAKNVEIPWRPPGGTDKEIMDIFYLFVSGLGNFERGVFLLYLDNKTYAEVSDITGLSQQSIVTRLKKVKEKFMYLSSRNPRLGNMDLEQMRSVWRRYYMCMTRGTLNEGLIQRIIGNSKHGAFISLVREEKVFLALLGGIGFFVLPFFFFAFFQKYLFPEMNLSGIYFFCVLAILLLQLYKYSRINKTDLSKMNMQEAFRKITHLKLYSVFEVTGCLSFYVVFTAILFILIYIYTLKSSFDLMYVSLLSAFFVGGFLLLYRIFDTMYTGNMKNLKKDINEKNTLS